MLLSPIQNVGTFDFKWIQVRPRITQTFGKNPAMYKQFGLNGHNGIDFGVPVGTHLFSPIEGVVYAVGDEGNRGYGKYIKLRKDNLEIVLGHLSEIFVVKGQHIYMGDYIGKTGNTGFSTGAHLHIGARYLNSGQIMNYNNGFKGYVDILPFLITWKGGFIKSNF